jgi:Na+-transporting methylmalonyl-CoA/oxaloacetate decarboxylase gamma subunit
MNLMMGIAGVFSVLYFFFVATWLMNTTGEHFGPEAALAVGAACIVANIVNGLIAGSNIGRALIGTDAEQ